MARAWHAWRARGYGAKPKARAPSIVALPAALGRSKPSIPRPAMTRVEKQSAFPRGPHPPASVSFFDEDPAWDAVVAAELMWCPDEPEEVLGLSDLIVSWPEMLSL